MTSWTECKVYCKERIFKSFSTLWRMRINSRLLPVFYSINRTNNSNNSNMMSLLETGHRLTLMLMMTRRKRSNLETTLSIKTSPMRLNKIKRKYSQLVMRMMRIRSNKKKKNMMRKRKKNKIKLNNNSNSKLQHSNQLILHRNKKKFLNKNSQ